MSAFKVFTGTLTGLIAGVALGMLTAPAKGSETRQKIVDKADIFKRKFRRFKGLAEEELIELRSVFENQVEGISDDVRERVLRLIHASEPNYQNIKEDAWGY